MEHIGDMEEKKVSSTAYKLIELAIILDLGLLAFSFGGNTGTMVLGLIGCQIIVFILAFLDFKVEKTINISFLKYLIPFFIFAILISFNRFFASGSIWIFSSIVTVVALVGMVYLGFIAKMLPGFSFRNVLVAIVGGLTLLVVINTFYSLVDYGFFYTIRYQSQSYFYDGFEFPIASETTILNGFSFTKVALRYGMFMPFVLGASLLSLPFFDYKKDKISFLTLAIGGSIGFLSLILIGYWKPILLYFVLAIFVGVWKFAKRPANPTKTEKMVFYVIYGLMSLFFFILLINSLKSTDWFSSSFLHKIFSNGAYTLPIEQVINLTLTKNGAPGFSVDFLGVLFGASPSSYTSFGLGVSDRVLRISGVSLKVFEFSALTEGGLICFLGLYVFLTFVVFSSRRYLHEKGEAPNGEKAFVILFLLAFFVYYSLSYDSFPEVFRSSNYYSIFRNNSFLLIALFFVGYSFIPKKLVETKVEPKPIKASVPSTPDEDDSYQEDIPND